jgi:hypothetical protein
MMITAGLVTSFKEQVLLGQHDLLNDVIKIALYDSSAVLGPGTTVYSSTGEVTSAGYTAGGEVLLVPVVGGSNGSGYASFADPIWYGTTFTVRGALIYNFTKSNKAIGVLNFGLDQVTLTQDFKIQFPAANPETAIIRVT